MKTITTVLVCAFIALAGTVSAQSKIGHVDFQGVLASLPEAKTVETQLNDYGTQLQTLYEGYLTEYQTKLGDYQANAGTWGEVKREAMEKDITDLEARIQEFQVTSQDKLIGKQNELMQPLIDKVQNAVKLVGDEKGLSYVLDATNVYHIGAGAIDITDAVKAKL